MKEAISYLVNILFVLCFFMLLAQGFLDHNTIQVILCLSLFAAYHIYAIYYFQRERLLARRKMITDFLAPHA